MLFPLASVFVSSLPEHYTYWYLPGFKITHLVTLSSNKLKISFFLFKVTSSFTVVSKADLSFPPFTKTGVNTLKSAYNHLLRWRQSIHIVTYMRKHTHMITAKYIFSAFTPVKDVHKNFNVFTIFSVFVTLLYYTPCRISFTECITVLIF